MANPVIFQIETGVLRFKVVDKAAVGYTDAWQAPGGKTVDAVTAADYESGSDAWSCQVTTAQMTAAQDTTTVDVPATFCAPAQAIPQPASTAFAIAATFLQDPNVSTGLNRYLFEHDTEEAYVYLGLDEPDPPRLIGRVRLLAGAIGGDARANLTADVELPMTRKPDVEFGDATTSVIIPGDGSGPTTPAAAAASSSKTATASK